MADVSARPTAWSSGQTLPWQAHPHKAPALLDFFAPATLSLANVQLYIANQ